MPIIGKVNAIPYECRVENMEIGTRGFVSLDSILITKKSIFLNLEVEVVIDDDHDENVGNYGYIPIQRIGAGFTENDYELDFSKSDEWDLNIDPISVEINLIKERDRFIIFTNFVIGVNNEGGISEPKSKLEILESRLQDAIDTDTQESYILAKEIIKEIEIEKLKIQDSAPKGK